MSGAPLLLHDSSRWGVAAAAGGLMLEAEPLSAAAMVDERLQLSAIR